MRYLLLGGAGFIGTHLAKRLIKEGHEVTVVDSLVTSSAPDYDVRFIRADIRVAVLDELLQEHDVVYFLASSVGVANIDKDPASALENNIGLMNKLIPLFRRYNKKVVFTSTSEVYGEGPFSEDNSLTIGAPTKLRWSYAAAKLMTEFMITASNFPYVIIRFFNVSGPGQLGDHGMVLPRFIQSAKNNSDVVIYGNGQQTRTFCHVYDAIEYMRRVESINNEIFNIGSDGPVTIQHLAETVVKVTNSKSKIVYMPYEQVFSKHHGDISNRVPNLSKLKYMTGYVPQYSLEDIIKDSL